MIKFTDRETGYASTMEIENSDTITIQNDFGDVSYFSKDGTLRSFIKGSKKGLKHHQALASVNKKSKIESIIGWAVLISILIMLAAVIYCGNVEAKVSPMPSLSNAEIESIIHTDAGIILNDAYITKHYDYYYVVSKEQNVSLTLAYNNESKEFVVMR